MREPVIHTAPRRHGHNRWESAPAQQPSLPRCRNCLTDAYLEYTCYVPATYALDRERLLPPVVSYNCTHCGNHDAQQVPEDWAPPGWQWYA